MKFTLPPDPYVPTSRWGRCHVKVVPFFNDGKGVTDVKYGKRDE